LAKFPIRMRQAGPLPFRYVFLLTTVFFILSTAISIWIINKGIEPTLIDIAEKETKRIANLIIDSSVDQQILNGDIDVNNLIKVEKDEYGKISSIDFDAAVVQHVLAKTNDSVQTSLKAAMEGNLDELEFYDKDIKPKEPKEKGIIYYIPLGQATNNTLLGNLGPRIPVRFYIMGNVESDVKETIQPFGINNALVKVYIQIEVNVQVVIPFATKTATVSNNIPIAMQVISGEVPKFYNNGGNVDPSIEMPSE
jgi:sporulation protein YunB